MFGKFYQGKKVFVSGHTGFKGAWLTAWLQSLGADVVGFSLEPDPSSETLFDAAGLSYCCHSVFGDVRDARLVRKTLRDHQPQIIFHLAAQALVRPSYRDPVGTFATNVMGTVNVLEAARHCGAVESIVNVTTDKCYENREWVWGYRENDRLGGFDPYSASKACSEIVTGAYRNSYGESQAGNIATARAGNVIGGGDWAEDRLVPDFVRSIADGQPIVLRSPAAVRPWQHVLEPLHGYLRLGQRLAEGNGRFADAWNFGPNRDSHITVAQLAKRMVAQWQAGSIQYASDDSSQPHETSYLALDCHKAHTQLEWQPLLDVDTTIEWTVDWYKAYSQKQSSAAELTRRQIDEFAARLETPTFELHTHQRHAA